MAMRSERRAWLRAGAVSATFLVVVLWLADPGEIDLARIGIRPLLGCLAAYVVAIALRGLTFRALCRDGAPAREDPARWIALAARHQLVFTLAPSGSGDLAFPMLARRITGLPAGSGIWLIAQSRFRDLVIVAGLGLAGLIGIGKAPLWAGLAILPAAAVLLRTDEAMAIARRRFGRLLARFRRPMAGPDAAPETGAGLSLGRQAAASALAIAGWLAASVAIASGFAAAGQPLSVAQALVMMAGINVVGALALSFAGLGVAELGAAGILVYLGLPLPQAAGIALVARPLLLASTLSASGLLDRGLALVRPPDRVRPPEPPSDPPG